MSASVVAALVTGSASAGVPNVHDDGTDDTTASSADGDNSVQRNTISGSVNHDCHDTMSGTGTASSANTWASSTATTRNVANLCFTGTANGIAD